MLCFSILLGSTTTWAYPKFYWARQIQNKKSQPVCTKFEENNYSLKRITSKKIHPKECINDVKWVRLNTTPPQCIARSIYFNLILDANWIERLKPRPKEICEQPQVKKSCVSRSRRASSIGIDLEAFDAIQLEMETALALKKGATKKVELFQNYASYSFPDDDPRADILRNEIKLYHFLNAHRVKGIVKSLRVEHKNNTTTHIIEKFTGPLSDYYLGNKSLLPTQILSVAGQLCRSIDQMHDLMIAHRDIKPENVLIKFINETPVIGIGDFDTSYRFDDDFTHSKAFEETALTPIYASRGYLSFKSSRKKNKAGPSLEEFNVHKKSDLWGYGLTILNLMNHGFAPWQSGNAFFVAYYVSHNLTQEEINNHINQSLKKLDTGLQKTHQVSKKPYKILSDLKRLLTCSLDIVGREKCDFKRACEALHNSLSTAIHGPSGIRNRRLSNK